MLYKILYITRTLDRSEIEKSRSIQLQHGDDFIQSEQEYCEELEYLKLKQITNDPLLKPFFTASLLIRGRSETLKVFNDESIPVVIRVFCKEYQLPKEIQSKLLERMYRLEEEMRNKIESEKDQHNMTGVDYTQQEQRQSGIHSKEAIIRSEEEQKELFDKLYREALKRQDKNQQLTVDANEEGAYKLVKPKSEVENLINRLYSITQQRNQKLNENEIAKKEAERKEKEIQARKCSRVVKNEIDSEKQRKLNWLAQPREKLDKDKVVNQNDKECTFKPQINYKQKSKDNNNNSDESKPQNQESFNRNEGIGLGQKMGTIDDSFFVPPPSIVLPQEQMNELTKKLY
ncbi:MAG: hypothetical protein EZS28_020293 [Streblomastix strix]|uniref:Uncharacterized protein n=1 Tax=Streblomastix strix TaxID=222440 RepID=A0A5J4VNJ7_9EUKA|nr:MAG: hypothetical protein EZS28_020293 [Streblomastix strix]